MAASVVLKVTPDVVNAPPRVRLDVSAAVAVSGATFAVTRTNLAANPAPNVDTTNWSGNAGTGGTAALARSVPGVGVYPAPFPNATNRLTWSVANTAIGGNVLHGSATKLSVDPTKPLSATCVTRASKVQRVALTIDWYTAGNVFISTTSAAAVILAANTATVLSAANLTPPPTAGLCQVYTTVIAGTSAALWAAGDWLEMGGLLVEQATAVGTYFDGTTAAAGEYTYAWSGAANASASQERTGAAVDVVITRTDPNNVASTVRLAGPVVLQTGVAVVFDYEAPYGASVLYTATSRTSAGVSISSMALTTSLAVT